MKKQLFTPNRFHIIRADKAGVFMGKIESIENGTAVCNSLRRLYQWQGALDVTQIAIKGVAKPSQCKFSVQMGENDKSTIFNVIEVHACTEDAVKSINSVAVWNAQ